jgi:hypothetical protein
MTAARPREAHSDIGRTAAFQERSGHERNQPALDHPGPRRDRSSGEHGQRYLALVTKKLVLFTAASLAVIAASVYAAQEFSTRSFLVPLVFGAGLIGGFVSMQQRLPKVSVGDLKRLSESWFAILLVPINGGIFAIVLHVAFLGGIVQGALFPTYALSPSDAASGAAKIADWMRNVAPSSATDLGKLIFWAFVAGFSERLVPQILQERIDGTRDHEPQDAPAQPEATQERGEKRDV